MDKIADRRNGEVFWILASHSTHVTPEQIFTTELGRPREMVNLLILVQVLDVICIDVARPLQVEEIRVT